MWPTASSIRDAGCAGHDQAHRTARRRAHGDVQGVGDDIDRLDVEPANLFRDSQPLVVPNRGSPSRVLMSAAAALAMRTFSAWCRGAFDADRLVVVILAQQRAACVRSSAPPVSSVARSVRIVTAEVANRAASARQCLAVLAQQFHDAVAAFRDQQAGLGVGAGCRCCAVPSG